jgi:hypothetical protein
MISERDDEQQGGRGTLLWSFLASMLVNILIWTAFTGRFSFLRAIATQQPEETFIVSSSSIHIERRTIPQPRSVPHSSRAMPRPLTRQPRVTRPKRAARRPESRPAEIARALPAASPQPRPGKQREQSLSEQLALQSALFAQEAARLNAQHAPISIATMAPQQPETYQRSYIDASGANAREQVEALLLPKQHWFDASLSCYYVHYYAQWSGGGSEEGNIPWPVCYPRDHDAMLPLNHPHVLPVPAPPIGYVLPPGISLTPLLRQIYTGAIRN